MEPVAKKLCAIRAY